MSTSYIEFFKQFSPQEIIDWLFHSKSVIYVSPDFKTIQLGFVDQNEPSWYKVDLRNYRKQLEIFYLSRVNEMVYEHIPEEEAYELAKQELCNVIEDIILELDALIKKQINDLDTVTVNV